MMMVGSSRPRPRPDGFKSTAADWLYRFIFSLYIMFYSFIEYHDIKLSINCEMVYGCVYNESGMFNMHD